MLWTDEAIEILRTLAIQGRSARAIADALGAPSRSAVIGKANRLGVKLNGGGPMGGERSRRGAEASARPVRQPRKPAGSGCALVSAFPREPRQPRWIFAEAEVGDMLRLAFEEISDTSCRWPLGDPSSEDFVYCGLPPARGRSYCAGHCRMAYQPPKGTREVGDGRPLVRLPAVRAERGAAILPFPSPGCDPAHAAPAPGAIPERADHPNVAAGTRQALAAS